MLNIKRQLKSWFPHDFNMKYAFLKNCEKELGILCDLPPKWHWEIRDTTSKDYASFFVKWLLTLCNLMGPINFQLACSNWRLSRTGVTHERGKHPGSNSDWMLKWKNVQGICKSWSCLFLHCWLNLLAMSEDIHHNWRGGEIGGIYTVHTPQILWSLYKCLHCFLITKIQYLTSIISRRRDLSCLSLNSWSINSKEKTVWQGEW